MLRPSMRFKTLLIFVGVLLLGTACIPVFGTQAGPITHDVLTPDGADMYQFQTNGATTQIHAPSWNHSSNLREFFWSKDSPYVADQESCTRWDSVMDASTPEAKAAITQADVWQPGVGLRIAPTSDGLGLRGISVDLNVWASAWWQVWVLMWDSTSETPYVAAASFDISAIVSSTDGLLAPPPWNVCAQAFGDTVRMKIWLGNHPEPAWSDSEHVFTTTLPPGWDYAGYPGNYVAHVSPGATQQITTLRTGVLEPDGSYPQSTPTSSPSSVPQSTVSVPPSSTTSTTATTNPVTTVPSSTVPGSSVPVSTTIAAP